MGRIWPFVGVKLSHRSEKFMPGSSVLGFETDIVTNATVHRVNFEWLNGS